MWKSDVEPMEPYTALLWTLRTAWLHFYAVVMLCVCSGKENKKYFISISKVERFC